MLRSATFVLGLILAGAAFFGFLVLGGILAPAPYSVVIAVQDIPAFSTLDEGMLGIDAERINAQVARVFVLREEVDQYLAGVTVETIHAGEPLRKSALIAANNPQAAKRLALMMSDPGQVAFVIPLDGKTTPQQIEPGDTVDIVIGMANGIESQNHATFPSIIHTPTPQAFNTQGLPGFSATGLSGVGGISTTLPTFFRATPAPTPPLSFFITQTLPVYPLNMNMPTSKVVIQNVSVLAVRFQQVPNPLYTGAELGSAGTGQPSRPSVPAYVPGDVQSVTVLVPREQIEILNWGIENAQVRLALLAPQAKLTPALTRTPSAGVAYNDLLTWMMRERAQVLSGTLPITPSLSTSAANRPAAETTPFASSAAVSQSPAPAQAATATRPAQPGLAVTAAPAATTSAKGASTNSTAGLPSAIPTDMNLVVDCGLPLALGIVFIVILIVAVRFVRKRRRDDTLV